MRHQPAYSAGISLMASVGAYSRTCCGTSETKPWLSTIFPHVRERLPEFGDVFELRVALRHLEPAIWRSVRVPADAPLGVLHDVLQVAFGWTDSHLHDFHVGDIRFGMANVEADEISASTSTPHLSAPSRARVRRSSTATISATSGTTR